MIIYNGKILYMACLIAMDKKDWKKTKKTGGFKRKLKKEYTDFIYNWSNQNKRKIIDVPKKQNTKEELEVLCEPSTSKAVSSRDSGENLIEEDNCIANVWSGDLCEPSTNQAVSLRDSGENLTEGDNCVANVFEFTKWSEAYSSSDDEEVCTEYMKDLIMRNKIREWAVAKNITQSALRDMASILNERYPGILPNDPRTLLKTPRQVSIKVVEPGTYWHNGIVEPLQIILKSSHAEQVTLNINMDGLPIFNSSKKEFWPILCKVHNVDEAPFVIGIYYGEQKPKDLNTYLEDFINEIQLLLKDGLNNGEKIIKVAIRCFICDSPARAYIKGVCNFNGKHGCLKCTTVGEYSYQSHTVVFPDSRCPERTDDHFRRKLYGSHHKVDSPLLQLPIDMVQDIPIGDSLHLLDLGIMKRLLFGWRDGNFGKKNTKWCSRDIEQVTAFLNQTKLPSEFHRSMRGLNHLSHWKASEFRTFFYYLSIIILPQVLSAEVFIHFLFLFCGITICSHEMYENLLPLAKELLLYFVDQYKHYYGADYITSNVHNLVHVVDEVKRFGVLHTFSSYPFENKLYLIKRMLREGKNPLAQVARRLSEAHVLRTNSSEEKKTHTVLIKHVKNRVEVHFKEFRLSTQNKDKYFMSKSDEIIELKEVNNHNNEITLRGLKITKLINVFEKPVKSSNFSIYKSNVNQQMQNLRCFTPQDVKFKYVCNEYQNELYFVPLLHTLLVS